MNHTSETSPGTTYTTPDRVRAFYISMICQLVLLVALVTVAAQKTPLPAEFSPKVTYIAAYMTSIAAAVAYLFFLISALAGPTHNDNNRTARAVRGGIFAAIPFLCVGSLAVMEAAASSYAAPPSPPVSEYGLVWLAAAALFAVPGVALAVWALLVSEADEKALQERRFERAGAREQARLEKRRRRASSR